MPREIIRELVYRAYEAYWLGHRDFVVDMLDDDIDWTFHGPAELLPIPNHMRGRAEVLAAYKRIDETTESLAHKLNLVLVDGERAAVIGERKFRQRSSGRIVQYKFVALHFYRNSRLVEYQLFVDTFDLAQQLLGQKIEIPHLYPR
jgi:ketosteroid isomerase-like protein